MEYKDSHTGHTRLLFDAHNAQAVQKQVPPIDQQMPNESQRLWLKVTEGIMSRDMNKATEAKSAIEDGQRETHRSEKSRVSCGSLNSLHFIMIAISLCWDLYQKSIDRRAQ